MEGVEPTCLAALDPKSSASANFATSAIRAAKVRIFDRIIYRKDFLAEFF